MRKRIVDPLPLSIAAGLFGRGEAWCMQLEGAGIGERFPVVFNSLALAGSDGGYEFEGRAVEIDRPVIGYVSPTYSSWIEIR